MSDTEDVYFKEDADVDVDADEDGEDVNSDSDDSDVSDVSSVASNLLGVDDDEDEDDEEIEEVKESGGVEDANADEDEGEDEDEDEDEDEGEDADEDEDEDGEDAMDAVPFQKLANAVNKQYLVDFHPESVALNYEEVLALSHITRDANGNPIDALHTTIPFLTKYEKTRILGQRAKQINAGAHIFVDPPKEVIDGYEIAKLELAEKRIPFIIRRPLPSGGSEYWRVRDLENIGW